MPNEDEVSPELDWAYSMQKRHADTLGYEIARNEPADDSGRADPNFKAVGRLFKELGVDDFDELYREHVSGREKLTPLDEPSVRTNYEKLLERIKPIALRAGVELDNYVLSSLPSGSISALFAKPTWDERKYIFTDSDLMIFNHSLSKILAGCFIHPSDDLDSPASLIDRRIVEHAKSDRTFKRLMLDLFGATTVLGYARASKPWTPEANQVRLAGALVQDMDVFVLTHEISHGVLGHLDHAHEASLGGSSFSDARALIMSHQQEHEADLSALYLSLALAQQEGRPASIAVLGAYSFLRGVELLYACHAIFDQSVGDLLSSHPKPSERYKLILSAAKDFARSGGHRDQIARQTRRIDQIFYWAGRHVLEKLKEMKAKGLKPREKKSQSILNLDRPSILRITADTRSPTPAMLERLRQLIPDRAHVAPTPNNHQSDEAKQ